MNANELKNQFEGVINYALKSGTAPAAVIGTLEVVKHDFCHWLALETARQNESKIVKPK